MLGETQVATSRSRCLSRIYAMFEEHCDQDHQDEATARTRDWQATHTTNGRPSRDQTNRAAGRRPRCFSQVLAHLEPRPGCFHQVLAVLKRIREPRSWSWLAQGSFRSPDRVSLSELAAITSTTNKRLFTEKNRTIATNCTQQNGSAPSTDGSKTSAKLLLRKYWRVSGKSVLCFTPIACGIQKIQNDT